METKLAIFQDKEIRKVWDSNEGDWYFSIIDIIEVLTESSQPRRYWVELKNKLKLEGFQLFDKIEQLKLKALDGKMRNTDVGNTKTILRLIQSIPSKKAEPFKLWLASIGDERINEIYDPELAFERAIDTYRKKGYSENWIAKRLKTIDIRKELTLEWKDRGIVNPKEYAILTDEIIKGWSDMTTKEYKDFKGLKKESLKDNMSNLELVFNMLGEVSTTEIIKGKDSFGFDEIKSSSKDGGEIAGKARKELEEKTHKKVSMGKDEDYLNEMQKNTKYLG